MARNPHPFPEIALSGNIYFAFDTPEAPADGDLRLKQSREDNLSINIEVFSDRQWHSAMDWHDLRELRTYMSSWSDPWALVRLLQRLLQALQPHMELKINAIFGYKLHIPPTKVTRAWIDAAIIEAAHLRDTHAPKI
jgi:hypothetical protein